MPSPCPPLLASRHADIFPLFSFLFLLIQAAILFCFNITFKLYHLSYANNCCHPTPVHQPLCLHSQISFLKTLSAAEVKPSSNSNESSIT